MGLGKYIFFGEYSSKKFGLHYFHRQQGNIKLLQKNEFHLFAFTLCSLKIAIYLETLKNNSFVLTIFSAQKLQCTKTMLPRFIYDIIDLAWTYKNCNSTYQYVK